MGDIADMDSDSFFECQDDMLYFTPRKINKPKSTLKCRSCNKENLIWKNIADRWILAEKNGNLHMCGGYEPTIDVLKIAAKETILKSNKKSLISIKNKLLKKDSHGFIVYLSDDQIFDLYTSLIKKNINNIYKTQIDALKSEMLKRIKNEL